MSINATSKDEQSAARYAHLSNVELRLARTRLGVEPHYVDGPPVAMLVGEAPPRAMGTCLALFPWPASSSAGRLLKMSGLSTATYLGRFYRRNLFDAWPGDRWPAREASDRALIIGERIAAIGDLRVLLLGAKVGAAFGLTGFFLQVTRDHQGDSARADFMAIPHPSGNNRLYNDAGVREATRGAMRWAAGLL